MDSAHTLTLTDFPPPPTEASFPRLCFQCCQPYRIIRESPEYLSKSQVSSRLPNYSKNHTNLHILMSIFEHFSRGGGMPPDPPSRALRLMPLAIPKPPEIQPPPGWQPCASMY